MLWCSPPRSFPLLTLPSHIPVVWREHINISDIRQVFKLVDAIVNTNTSWLVLFARACAAAARTGPNRSSFCTSHPCQVVWGLGGPLFVAQMQPWQPSRHWAHSTTKGGETHAECVIDMNAQIDLIVYNRCSTVFFTLNS